MALTSGGVYFSSEEFQPETTPLESFSKLVAGYGIIGAGLYAATTYRFDKNNPRVPGITAFDLMQKHVRNRMDATPLSVGNTFRMAEYMTPFMSGKGKGLTFDNKAGYFYEDFDFDLIKNNKGSLETLRATLGSEAMEAIQLESLKTDTSGTKLQYRQKPGVHSKGELFLIDGAKKETKLSSEVALFPRDYASDAYDVLIQRNKRPKINPATGAVLQGFHIYEKLGNNTEVIERMFTAERINPATQKTEIFSSRFIIGPSPFHSDPKKAAAVLTAPLSGGIQRFNKLLAATANQMPLVGNFFGGMADSFGLSMKTVPGPFYKQFFQFGVNAGKIGAVYAGIRTLDHYRREGGTLGHLGISAAIGYGAQAIADRSARAPLALQKGRLGVGLFAAQMLPGFSQGIKEGVLSTAANLDIARSYAGMFSGLSYYRRTIEGMFPGFTDPTVGAAIGLTLGVASALDLGKLRLREGKEPILPDFIRNRIGFHPDINSLSFQRRFGIFKQEELYKALYSEIRTGFSYELGERVVKMDEYHPLFSEFNRLQGQQLEDAVSSYRTRVADFLGIQGNETFEDLTKEQKKKLKSVLNEFSSEINPVKQEAQAKILDFYFSHTQDAKSKYFELTRLEDTKFDLHKTQDVDLNTALLKRLNEIDKSFADSEGLINKGLKKLQMFGAQVYHSYFGATMEGANFDKEIKRLDIRLPFRRFGSVFAGGFLLHQFFTSGFLGSMDDPGELQDIYYSGKNIEVKTGRYWEAGGTPYKGLETAYLRPHLYHLMMSRAEEKSVWGDDDSRFNPITKFFLKNFTNYLEEKQYYDRPYPISSPAFSDVPIIGNLLASSIGSLIKPPKLMHVDEIAKIGEGGELQFAQAREYGSKIDTGGLGQPVNPYTGARLVGDIQYQFRELEGLTGFSKNMFQKIMTGRETFGSEYPVLASSRSMDSDILNYWDMEAGGALFMSEPIRRILPRPRSEIEQYNPIMNSMPSWLPDRFKRGDPYRNITMGFARLPGLGYESLHPELKGIDPEDYPDIYKLKILADVAPTSKEIANLRESLFQRRAAGISTEFENTQLDLIMSDLSKRLAPIRDFEGHENQIRIPIVSDITRGIYSTALSAVRHITAPAEFLIPAGFRPVQKLLSENRTAIETYEYDRLYATPNAFWNKPIRDWIRPSFYSALHAMGWQGKPAFVEERNSIDSHFDKLNFMKFMMLSQSADNPQDRKRFLRLASQTRYGVNPNGDAMSIYMSLPKEEQAYFVAFANAQEGDRDRILEMVPEDQAHLYQSVWSRMDTGENLSFYPQSKTQLNEDYLMQRFYELEGNLEGPMPSVDWIGWHKDVDINDIKIKYISSLGRDLNDYNAWDSQARRVNRKQYLNKSEMFAYEAPMNHRTLFGNVVNSLNKNYLKEAVQINYNHEQSFTNTPTSRLSYNDDRGFEIARGLRRYAGVNE